MMRWFRNVLLAAVPLFTCIGCISLQDWFSKQPATPQGWTWEQRNAWYVADQGSRLIPQKWIDALEQPGDETQHVGDGKFVDAAYLAQFNYMPSSLFDRNGAEPSCPIDKKLPIGFVTDCQDSSKFGVTKLNWLSRPNPTEPWVGMNCAACHTNTIEVSYTDRKSKPDETLVVDGAPTLADFESFMAALEKALVQTYRDDQKFNRFAAAVLPADLPADELGADKLKLHQAMLKLITWNHNLAHLNDDPDTDLQSGAALIDTTRAPYGYGRLDAIGHIFNKVALAALPNGVQTDNRSDAPVSYPFLWNVPQLDKVEWNGVAANTPIKVLGIEDFNALGRNTGEVTGVFADLTVTPHTGVHGYVSSARIDRLNEFEQHLRSLHAPAWPARLGLNQTSVDKGRDLFKTQCSGCHAVPTKGFGDTTERFEVNLTALSDVKTDMWMACNFSFDQAQAGTFTGEHQNLIDDGSPIPSQASNFSLTRAATVGTILGQPVTLIESVIKAVLGLDNDLPHPQGRGGFKEQSLHDRRVNQCTGAMKEKKDPHYAQLVYKGRPLQGIWATAPYLHNGSVPSLWLLLQPSDKRPREFCVGSHVFNPKEVGFEYEFPKNGDCPANTSKFDAALDGNSNKGHDYGTTLSEDQRWALIEYMKTL